jgi:hypothetical protein
MPLTHEGNDMCPKRLTASSGGSVDTVSGGIGRGRLSLAGPTRVWRGMGVPQKIYDGGGVNTGCGELCV